MFRKIRVMLLLYALLLVAGGTWLTVQRTTDWDTSLWVAVHPIAADDSEATRSYIEKLDDASLADISDFFAREGRRFALGLDRPFEVRRSATLTERPPAPPDGGSALEIMWWSLTLRWWSWQVGWEHDDPPAKIRVYAIYYDPERTKSVPHSLGLQKGLIGVVHGFAGRKMHRSNNMVIAHELAHTVGATDKYDPASNQPFYPDGYAEPERKPRYPQRYAELMGGRVPKSADEARIPKSLKRVRIGPQTAGEMNWLR
ncbi:MAG: hypothetical protein AAF458_16950 [Pseudomonadota bacterium]